MPFAATGTHYKTTAKLKAPSGLNKIVTALSSPLSNNYLAGKDEYTLKDDKLRERMRKEEGRVMEVRRI